MRIGIKLEKKHWVLISGMCVLAVMLVIFLFSSQNVDASDGLSGKITGVLMKILKKISELLPKGAESNTEYDPNYSFFNDLNHYVRKLAHVTEYALLGGTLTWHFRARTLFRDKLFTYKYALIGILTGFLYACSDEFHQIFVDGRGAQFKDVLIDTVGVCLGIGIVYIIVSYVNKKSSKNS